MNNTGWFKKGHVPWDKGLKGWNAGKANPCYGMKFPETSERMKRINPMNNPEIAVKVHGVNGEKSPSKRPEVREKISAAAMGRKDSPETSVKRSVSHIGKKSQKQSEWFKSGQASYLNSLIKNPSKPQVQLFEMVKALCPSAVLNYLYGKYCIDIVVPEPKIAIEYDGEYWHKGKEEHDRKRQQEIEQDGWKFLRYSKLPEDSKLLKDLEGR